MAHQLIKIGIMEYLIQFNFFLHIMIRYAKNIILNYKDEIDDENTKHNSKGILISKCKDVY